MGKDYELGHVNNKVPKDIQAEMSSEQENMLPLSTHASDGMECGLFLKAPAQETKSGGILIELT